MRNGEFRPAPLTGWRAWSLALAVLLTAACLFSPTLPLQRPVYRYLMVIDITQSMNAQDYRVDGMPRDRLGFVKASLHRALADLPCGSEVGLGLFTTQNTQILFDPLEICGHFAAIDAAVEHLDWRMAWAADSFIAHGLFSAMDQLARRETLPRLVFFSDGQQIPENHEQQPFQGAKGAVAGLIVGVGGRTPVPIPKLDQDNKPLGYWQVGDLDLGPGQPPSGGDSDRLLLSRLDEGHLSTLAAQTGLGYHRLTDAEGLAGALRRPELAVSLMVQTDIRPALGLVALLLWLSGLRGLGRRHRG